MTALSVWPQDISSTLLISGGIRKCMFSSLRGCATASAISLLGYDDEFVVSIASWSASWSTVASNPRLTARSSATDSMISHASRRGFRALARAVVDAHRATAGGEHQPDPGTERAGPDDENGASADVARKRVGHPGTSHRLGSLSIRRVCRSAEPGIDDQTWQSGRLTLS